MEGISHEAISLAGHLKLSKLIVLWDDNGITIDGADQLRPATTTSGALPRQRLARHRVDGHDPDAIAARHRGRARDPTSPSLIACRTMIGFGAPNKQGTEATHGSPLGDEEIAAAREALGWHRAARSSSGRDPGRLARGRRPEPPRREAWQAPARRARRGHARGIRPPHGRRPAGRLAGRPAGAEAQDRGRAAEARDAQGLARLRSTC